METQYADKHLRHFLLQDDKNFRKNICDYTTLSIDYFIRPFHRWHHNLRWKNNKIQNDCDCKYVYGKTNVVVYLLKYLAVRLVEFNLIYRSPASNFNISSAFFLLFSNQCVNLNVIFGDMNVVMNATNNTRLRKTVYSTNMVQNFCKFRYKTFK